MMTVTSPYHEELANHAVLNRWYAETAMGKRLSDQFSRVLSQVLEQVFGYQMLVTGADTGLDFSQMVKTQRVFRLGSTAPIATTSRETIGSTSELPFAADSIDALILCHALDTSPVPHSVLRECRRVLVPNGHLVVMSFSFTALNCSKSSCTSPVQSCFLSFSVASPSTLFGASSNLIYAACFT